MDIQPDPAAMELFESLDKQCFGGQFKAEGRWCVYTIDPVARSSDAHSVFRFFDGETDTGAGLPPDTALRTNGECDQRHRTIWVNRLLTFDRQREVLLHEMCHAEVKRRYPSGPLAFEHERLCFPEGRMGLEYHDGRFIAELTRLALLHGERWAADEAAFYSLESARRVLGFERLQDNGRELRWLRRTLRRTDRDIKESEQRNNLRRKLTHV